MPTRRHFSADDVAAYYREYAPFYRACWGEHQHHGFFTGSVACRKDVHAATERLVDRAAEWLILKPGEAVVDVGCGEGATARRMALKYGVDVDGVTLAGVDALVRSGAGSGRVRIFRRDWMESGLAAGSYDAAVSIECLAHVADKPGFFAELERVLRPGGRAAVLCWMTSGGVPGAARRFVLDPAWASGCVNGVASGRAMRRWACEAGFEVKRFGNWARWTAPTWDAIGRRMAWMVWADARFRRRFLFGPRARDLGLALAVPRIMLAYRMGWLGYAAMLLSKPATSGPDGAAR